MGVGGGGGGGLPGLGGGSISAAGCWILDPWKEITALVFKTRFPLKW